MIDRYSIWAGIFAGVIFGLLYLAYEVTQGWEIPVPFVIGLGVIIVITATVTTELVLRGLIAEASKEV